MDQFLHICVTYANWLTIGLGAIFSLLSLYYSNKHHSEQLRSYVPTIWTSLGIFFTFLSIYVTLKDYTALPGDQIVMGGIIKGIIPAFSTSVIGIFFAILTAYFDRWKKSRLEAMDNLQLMRFSNGELTAKEKVNTPDLVLLELVREINNSINSTQSILNELSKGIKEDLENNTTTLCDKLELNNTAAIESSKITLEEQRKQLQSYVETFVSDANESYKKQISEILKNFDKESESREERHLSVVKELAETARTNSNLIRESLCKESEDRKEAIRQFLSDERNDFCSFVGEQNGLMTESLQQCNSIVQNAVERIKDLFESDIKSDIKDFAQEQYEKCIEIIETEYKTFFENSEKVLVSQESENADFIKLLSGSLNETHSSIVSDIRDLKDAILLHLNSLLDENNKAVASLFKQHTEEFSSISKIIQQTSDVEKEYIGSATREMEDNLTKLLEKYKEELARTSSCISSSAETMASRLELFCENLQHNEETLESKHMDAVGNIHKKGEDAISAALTTQTLRIEDALGLYKTQLENVSETITETGKRMADNLEKFCHDIDLRTEELEKKHFVIVEGIHKHEESTINNIGIKLTKDVESLVNKIQELRSDVNSSTKEYVGKHVEMKNQVADSTTLLIKEMTDAYRDSSQIKTLEQSCDTLNTKLKETIAALDNKYQTITDSLENVATSIESYSKVADDTKTLILYVNSTIDLYKAHSTQMTLLESSLKEMANTIQSSLDTIRKNAGSVKQEPKALTNAKKK